MNNRRRDRPSTFPDYPESRGFRPSHPPSTFRPNRGNVIMSNHTTVPINGGSDPRRQRSHHQAGPGQQYQIYNNPRSRHLHAGPHYLLQMSTQNYQIQFHPAEHIPVLSPASAPTFQRAPPNPGQHQRRHHRRRHNQTFQQPQHNRNQFRVMRHQLNEIRLEDENGVTSMQTGFHHHHNNRHRYHRRGHNHHQAAASYTRSARTQSQPQNSQQTQVQAVATESSGQREAIEQSQIRMEDENGQTQVQAVATESSGQREAIEQSQIRLEDENDVTSMQTGFHHHHNNRHRYHRRGRNHHQAAASYTRSARTQSQPQNSQQTQVQAVATESSGQREAIEQSQPLASDRPAQIQTRSASSTLPRISGQREASAQSQPLPSEQHRPRPAEPQSQQTNRQQPSVQRTPPNIAGGREAMASPQMAMLQQLQPHPAPPQSVLHDRLEPGSLTHENQWHQPNANSGYHWDRRLEALMSLYGYLFQISQVFRNNESSTPGNHSQQPNIFSRDYIGRYLASLISLLHDFGTAPQRPRDYQELFRLLGHHEDVTLTRTRAAATQPNTTATQPNTAATQHNAAASRHIDEATQHNAAAPQHNAAAPQHNAAAPQHNAAATQNNNEPIQHNAAATQHNAAAAQHNAAAPQYNAAALQHNAAVPQSNAAATQHNAAATQHNAAATQPNAAATQNNNEAAQHNATATQNNEATQHNAAATQHNAAATQSNEATQHNAAATQNNNEATQHNAAATQHNAAATQNNNEGTHVRDDDIQRLADDQFSSEDDFSDVHSDTDSEVGQNPDISDEEFTDTDSEVWQIPDYRSSSDNGLGEDKIQEIPTRQFSRGAERSGSDQTSCVFCICDFEDKQLLRILPCFHEFHAKCVDEWLKTQHTCPVCRHDLRRTNVGQE
ncbi:E3 ubiquitin-protein ligase rnf13 [Plakobranchus ocellatus]|uniref:E3 ubiquitin-protein ligase rnf13 n=1 Tax=Plakobranchus ocellatus TaxID=259542 RepID=A0AAV4E1E7_9GAST|nr:E3 ubiquitin-protein ligase rnf13 [Plakobranchus ocellatus]